MWVHQKKDFDVRGYDPDVEENIRQLRKYHQVKVTPGMTWRPEQIQILPPDTSERVGPLSGSVWCDIDDKETNVKGQIGHPMSTKDPERQHFTQTQTVRNQTGNNYGTPTYQDGQEVTQVLDICGYHWRKQNPFAAQEPTAIEAVEAEAVEAEADMWHRKYDAEVEKNKRRTTR